MLLVWRMILVLGLCVAFSEAAGADTAVSENPGGAGSSTDPKVTTLLDEVASTYRGLDRLHVRVRVAVTSPQPVAVAGQWPDEVELWYQHPDKYHLDARGHTAKGKAWHTIMVSDGTTLYRWSSLHKKKYYAGAVPSQADSGKLLAEVLPEAALLTGGSTTSLVPDDMRPYAMVVAVRSTDAAALDATRSDRGVGAKPGMLTAEWSIGRSDHLLHAFHGTGAADYRGRTVPYQVRATYALLDTHPTFAAADFRFVPPDGARLAGARERRAAAHARRRVRIVPRRPARVRRVRVWAVRPRVARRHARVRRAR